MTPTADLVDAGRRYHQAGELGRAEEAYREALRADPRRADVWLLLGGLLQAGGRQGEAEAAFRQVAELKPDDADTQHRLGLALARAGRPDEAAAYLRRVVGLQPQDAAARSNLGNLLHTLGRPGEAQEQLHEAVRLRPDYPEAHYNLGNVLLALGRHAEAETCYLEALRLRPGYADAHANLGNALLQRGDLDGALLHHRRAVSLRPGSAEGHYNLGVVLARQGRSDGALACYREAVRLQPDHALAHNNLGCLLRARANLDQAVRHLRQAARARPDNAEAWNNLAVALREQGHPEEAIACYDEAIRLRPDDAGAHRGKALALLLLEDFERGWPEYEWRWRGDDAPPAVSLNRPRWDGSLLAGRTLLLWTEQGLGDTIQFVRYAGLAKAQGANVVLACPGALVPLLRSCRGIDRLVPQGEPLPPCDVHAPLMSLPLLFGTTAASVPADVPYLSADPALVQRWGPFLDPLPGFKVGIAWQGNPSYRDDGARSVPLVQFEALAHVPGARLVSLQKGPGIEQLRELSARFAVSDPGPGLDEAAGAFMDTAAISKGLDLVVTADTSLAHLAGALGVPVWVVLPFAPDWRWGLGRDDNLWYPSMRLFRQESPGDWEGVFRRVARSLAEMTASQRPPAPSAGLRLNLGCGAKRLPGFVNVDKFGEPDLKFDLEAFPWPWPDDSVEEVLLCHVLEHLGQSPPVYLRLMQELYRVCRRGALVRVVVPHWRHDNFFADPTHVRAVTPLGLQLFSKRLNRRWAEEGLANSPLGLYLDVDFDLREVRYKPSEHWYRLHPGSVDQALLLRESALYGNLIEQISMVLEVMK
jgi:tetratricopeptide (TPR) repeat protein